MKFIKNNTQNSIFIKKRKSDNIGIAKPKVIVGAYACSPILGSEFAQGWNYSRLINRYYDATILVGSSDGEMGHFDSILKHFENNYSDVTYVLVKPDFFCKLILYFKNKFSSPWLFVLALRRWNKIALDVARELHSKSPFQVSHQLGPLGFKNPGLLFKLGIPSYLGPVGGFQFTPMRLAFYSSISYGIVSILRNVINLLLVQSPYINDALRGYSKCSFVTTTNKENFAKYFSIDGQVISDQGSYDLDSQLYISKCYSLPFNRPLKIVWCGSLDDRKNVSLLLSVISGCNARKLNIDFTIIGSGKRENLILEYINKQKCSNVSFLGRVDRLQVFSVLKNSDSILFTSLSEANTATYFEALSAYCVPVALNIDGFIDNSSVIHGKLIDVTLPYRTIIKSYVDYFSTLLSNPAKLKNKIDEIHNNYSCFTWETIVKKHSDILKSLLIP